ncbi:hypothetical protein C4572_03115 [Candidatus Parcubacteria bacterium]|nr:MAG: hypothetical protein C4572_03115 [Candidatus Parcubacteria bacterium]
MTLTTHAMIGAGLAAIFPGSFPVGFAAAFASHYLLDAIPHWDYHLGSHKKGKEGTLEDDLKIDKNFLKDILKISFDFFLGLALTSFIYGFYFKLPWPILFIGLIGGVLPDLLQFFYFKIRKEPLRFLQKIHLAIHNRNDFLRVKFPVLGVLLQAVFIVIFLFFLGFCVLRFEF